MPRSECKKIFPSRSNCQEWIASNEKYLQSKAEKEAKRKRKREEKKSPGRWTRSDETKLLAEKHKRIKKQQADNQQTTKNEDKGKEEVVDVEQESEMNERLEKQKQAETEKKIKNKGKEKVVDVEDESETNERVQKQSFNRVLKGRATVRPLFEAMRGLTPQRKRVVREMGFGNLIDFPIVEIPTKLAFYVVDILNTRKMMLECPMGDIVITPKTVKEVLGLPMGRRKLEREGQREYNDPFLEEWKDQFKNINKLTIKALSDLIIDTKNTDYMFRMNILTLIANTLGSCENSSCLKFTVLRNVFEGDDVSDIDWCSYIIECASVSKVDWSKTKKKKDVVYYGPVMFLMLTYLHYTKIDTFKVKRRVPAFKSWNTRLLKKREISELQNYYMGIAEILDDVGEKEENEEKEELYELIEESIESILIDKAEIEEKINENLIKFQNDERLIQLRDKMKVIFKEPNIPEYHSSSSTESDDDDDDNSQVGDDNEKRKSLFGIDIPQRFSADMTRTVDQRRNYRDGSFWEEAYSEHKKRKSSMLMAYLLVIILPEKKVSNDNEGLILFRRNIQSLAPRIEIDTSVPGILEDKTTEIDKKIDAQYERFHEMLLIQMENDVEKMQMEDVELAFFPIIAHGHYYLIVFNIKTGKSVIIDNSESDATYVGKYKDNVEFVRVSFMEDQLARIMENKLAA
ncbi:hypothetical protein Tco_1103974 [Tanacetum coccineum]